MPIFEYTAKEPGGRAIQGLHQSRSLEAAQQELVARGLAITSVREAGSVGDPLRASTPAAPSAPAPTPTSEAQGLPLPPVEPRSKWLSELVGPLIGRVHLKYLSFFFHQLAAMLDAGVNPVQSLDTLNRQTPSRTLAKIIREMRDHVNAGRPLTAGMQRYPEVFTPLVMSLMRAGEEGGFVDKACKDVASYLDDEIELRNLIRRETMYPKVVLVASILIIGGANAIISAVAPGAPGLQSPLTTWATWLWLGPLIVLLWLFVRLVLRQQPVKYVYDLVVLMIPWLGKTVRGFAMAKFGRALGWLYRGGVPIPRAIQLAADSCGNEVMRARLYPAAEQLSKGVGIADALRATNALSPIVLDMAATGERTGELDRMLIKTAEYYEDESKTAAKQMAVIFGVAVLLGVAIYVASIVISFYAGHFGRIMQGV